MEYALSTAPQHLEWAELLEVWQAADGAPGLHSAWLFDHFYPIFSDPTGPCLEAWTTLAALAAATRRIRLGVLVTANVHRHPSVLANMVATVDVVSGGRLEIGLGPGCTRRSAARTASRCSPSASGSSGWTRRPRSCACCRPGHVVVRRPLLPAGRRAVRAQAGAAPDAAARHRRQR